MAENAARIRWAGAGVSLPRRLTTPRGMRLAVRRVLGEPRYRRRAEELRDWATRNDGASAAADAVESSPNRTKIRKERVDCVSLTQSDRWSTHSRDADGAQRAKP